MCHRDAHLGQFKETDEKIFQKKKEGAKKSVGENDAEDCNG